MEDRMWPPAWSSSRTSMMAKVRAEVGERRWDERAVGEMRWRVGKDCMVAVGRPSSRTLRVARRDYYVIIMLLAQLA